DTVSPREGSRCACPCSEMAAVGQEIRASAATPVPPSSPRPYGLCVRIIGWPHRAPPRERPGRAPICTLYEPDTGWPYATAPPAQWVAEARPPRGCLSV